MWFPMFRDLLSSLRSTRVRAQRPKRGVPLQVEQLEDRDVPSGAVASSLPSLSISDVKLLEGSDCGVPGVTRTPTPFTFTVSLSAASAQTVTVDFATADGTAVGGATIGTGSSDPDYQALAGTLTFAPGETSKTITVNVNPDVRKERNETFYVNLSNATNAVVGDSQGTGTILNDDAAKTACGYSAAATTDPMSGSPAPLDGASSPATNILVNDPAADTTIQDTQSETAIVLGAGSKIVVAYNDTRTYQPGVNWQSTGYALSVNGGKSFTDQGAPADPGLNDFGDPVLARSSRTGTIFMSTVTIDTARSGYFPQWVIGDNVDVFRSTDNGATFNPPVSATPGFTPVVDQQDKPWIAVDNFAGPGYGTAYLVWRDFSSNPANNGIFLTRSTDDGLNWGPAGGTLIADAGWFNVQGANVVVGPDHAVYVFWLDQSKGLPNPVNLRMRKSTDQGVTFGETVIIAGLKSQRTNGDLGLTDDSGRVFRTNALPQAAVNPITGDVYLVYADQPNGSKDKADIFLIQSGDGGKKWSKPIRVNDDATNNDQWQPALAMTPDGSHVGVFWYDRRLDPADNLIDRFGVIGSVSGHTVTFAPNFRITDVSFPPAFGYDPVENPSYMGDYDMATADNNYFYTTWGDNRLGDNFNANQPDVRFAKIPVSGLATAASFSISGTAATSAQEAATRPVDFVAAAFPLPWGDRGSWAAPPTPVAASPTWEAPPRASHASVDRYFADATTEDRTFTDSGSRPDAGAVTVEGLTDVLGQDSWFPQIA